MQQTTNRRSKTEVHRTVLDCYVSLRVINGWNEDTTDLRLDIIMGQTTSRSISSKKHGKRHYRSRKADEAYLKELKNTIRGHRTNQAYLKEPIRSNTGTPNPPKNGNLVARRMFPVEIIQNELFLSDSRGVLNTSNLTKLGITHVLNVGGGMAAFLPPEAYKEAGLEYHMINNTRDEGTYPMLEKHWEEAKSFLEASDCCVVHCLGGENRSVLIATAYYMIHTNTPLLETIDHCCKKVGGERFLTNPGFQQQLVALARYERLLESV
jgi:hypothetical protein